MRFISLLSLFAIITCLLQLAQAQPVRGSHRAPRVVTKLERLNRILEKRQKHEYDANESYKYLRNLNYKVWSTKIIAGHFRQVRQLLSEFPYDRIVMQRHIAERSRMDVFVQDVDELNALTDNRLYYKFGLVKDQTWDSLTGFILDEIERCRRG